MIEETDHFLEECDVLASALNAASPETFATVTQFKNWTIDDVIAHLFMWNVAADLTLSAPDKFREFIAFALARMGAGETHPQVQRAWLDEHFAGLCGDALFAAWRDQYPKLAQKYRDADPEARVAWAGPDMSVRAKIIARQMETWAHGQEIFDALGVDRVESDRIRNIAHLGVTTYSWAFRNRDEPPPSPKPYVLLTAPSGAEWTWNDAQAENAVIGDAVDFCRVVTQTRNIGDTNLVTKGETAGRWMAIAQCFAGPPEDPPRTGARHKSRPRR